MPTAPKAGHDAARSDRRVLQPIGLIAASLLTLVALAPTIMAQDSAASMPSPHWITAPSLPVRGPKVRSTPIPPGAMVPRPGVAPPPEHMIGIRIDGFNFMMHRGRCVRSVDIAIQAHEDLLTGDQACDDLIRQARVIQRRKEAEDPAYARAMHPVPTPDLSNDNETH
jgi:hypothetical protein